jgi:hypothetical protein
MRRITDARRPRSTRSLAALLAVLALLGVAAVGGWGYASLGGGDTTDRVSWTG